MAHVFTTLNDLMGKLEATDAEYLQYEIVVREKTTRAPIEYDLVDVTVDKENNQVVLQIELRED